MNLIEFFKVCLAQPVVQDYLKVKHQIVFKAHVDVETFIQVVKMICAAMYIACPFIDELP